MRQKKVIVMLVLIILSSISSFAIDFDIKAESAILIDQKNGRTFYKKNIHEKLPIASMSKIMSILVVLEALETKNISLDEKVKISSYASKMGGSQIWLEPKEEMTIRDLLKAVLIVSANDACVALAEATYGNEEVFVEKMNNKAKELGLENTKFYNTNGLPDDKDNYSTAHDLSILARELIRKYPVVLDDTKIWVDYLRDGESFLRNTNELVNTTDYIDGLKTGFTNEAGFCVTATGAKNGNRFISVILKAPKSDIRFEEAKKLINYGIYNVRYVNIVNKNEKIGKLKVINGKEKEVTVFAKQDLIVPLLYGEQDKLKTEKKIDENLKAPIKKGDVLGVVNLFKDKEKLGTVEIISQKDIPKANLFVRIFRYIGNFISNLV